MTFPHFLLKHCWRSLNIQRLYLMTAVQQKMKIYGKVKSLPKEQKNDLVVRILKAIHLPQTDKHFLFFLLKEFGDIPEARDLIMSAGEKLHPSEKREWYLRRAQLSVQMTISVQDKLIEVNGGITNEYSECALIKGFPFFIYIKSTSEGEKEYHVESPVAIEHLGLPYRVIVHFRQNEYRWLAANVYHNGMVDTFLDQSDMDLDDDDFELKVTFEL